MSCGNNQSQRIQATIGSAIEYIDNAERAANEKLANNPLRDLAEALAGDDGRAFFEQTKMLEFAEKEQADAGTAIIREVLYAALSGAELSSESVTAYAERFALAVQNGEVQLAETERLSAEFKAIKAGERIGAGTIVQ